MSILYAATMKAITKATTCTKRNLKLLYIEVHTLMMTIPTSHFPVPTSHFPIHRQQFMESYIGKPLSILRRRRRQRRLIAVGRVLSWAYPRQVEFSILMKDDAG